MQTHDLHGNAVARLPEDGVTPGMPAIRPDGDPALFRPRLRYAFNGVYIVFFISSLVVLNKCKMALSISVSLCLFLPLSGCFYLSHCLSHCLSVSSPVCLALSLFPSISVFLSLSALSISLSVSECLSPPLPLLSSSSSLSPTPSVHLELALTINPL